MVSVAEERKSSDVRESERTAQGFYTASSYAAADIAATLVQQSQQGLQAGWRALVTAQEPIAFAGHDFARLVLSSITEIAEIYRSADDYIIGDFAALSAAYGRLSRGVPEWTHAWIDLTQRCVERLGARHTQCLRSASLAELAAAQRDLCQECVHTGFVATTTLLQLALRVTQEAIRPLQQRTQEGLRD
jgi:Phasin protein